MTDERKLTNASIANVWAPVMALLISGGLGCGSLRPWSVTATFRFGPVVGREVGVSLWQKSGECITLPPTTRATLDGVELEVMEYGGQRAATTQLLSLSAPWPSCAAPRFRTRLGWEPSPVKRNEIIIEVEGRRGVVEVDGFFVARQIELISAPVLVPGEEVVLRWLPGSEEWGREDEAATVMLYWPGESLARVDEARVRRVGDTFRFVMPVVRPGPVRLLFTPGDSWPKPHTHRCRGFTSCDVGLSGLPGELQLVVSPVSGASH